jgi:hypothetical protein
MQFHDLRKFAGRLGCKVQEYVGEALTNLKMRRMFERVLEAPCARQFEPNRVSTGSPPSNSPESVFRAFMRDAALPESEREPQDFWELRRLASICRLDRMEEETLSEPIFPVADPPPNLCLRPPSRSRRPALQLYARQLWHL